MRFVLNFVLIFFVSLACLAEMIPGDRVGNDPARERLCVARSKGKPVAFEIDSRYVEQARASHPDVTFVVTDGMGPQLIECYLREGTGRFEPASFSPPQSFWRLQGAPKSSAARTTEGVAKASKTCLAAVPGKIDQPGFDHAIYRSVVEIDAGSPKFRPGMAVGGLKASRYDVAVSGTAFYRSTGLDLRPVDFTCLLSPSLDLIAISLN